MFMVKMTLVLLVIFCLYQSYKCQVSFSTNWGSGKRSGMFAAPTDQSSICLSRMEYSILKDLTAIIRRELRQAAKCLQENKEFEYEFSNNQRFIEQ